MMMLFVSVLHDIVAMRDVTDRFTNMVNAVGRILAGNKQPGGRIYARQAGYAENGINSMWRLSRRDATISTGVDAVDAGAMEIQNVELDLAARPGSAY